MWFHDRTPTYYAQGPGFPPQHHQKKNPPKTKTSIMSECIFAVWASMLTFYSPLLELFLNGIK